MSYLTTLFQVGIIEFIQSKKHWLCKLITTTIVCKPEWAPPFNICQCNGFACDESIDSVHHSRRSDICTTKREFSGTNCKSAEEWFLRGNKTAPSKRFTTFINTTIVRIINLFFREFEAVYLNFCL